MKIKKIKQRFCLAGVMTIVGVPLLGLAIVISISKPPVVAKTVADLKAEITAKSSVIKGALNGETSKMEIDKVKTVLKAKLYDAYDALINALTLKSKADGNVVVTSGSIEIIIKTSTASSTTTSTVKTIADLQAAIKTNADAIKNALVGKTSEMTLKKIKGVLKAKLDDTYNALINKLILKSKEHDRLLVSCNGKDFIIKSLTTISGKTYKEFLGRIKQYEENIKKLPISELSNKGIRAGLLSLMRHDKKYIILEYALKTELTKDDSGAYTIHIIVQDQKPFLVQLQVFRITKTQWIKVFKKGFVPFYKNEYETLGETKIKEMITNNTYDQYLSNLLKSFFEEKSNSSNLDYNWVTKKIKLIWDDSGKITSLNIT